MRTKAILESADIAKILTAAKDLALKEGWKVSIAVVDAGGALMGFERLDGANPMTAEVAQMKARTAAMTLRPSKFWGELIKTMPGVGQFPHVLAAQGGVPILHEGECLGAVGVSGAKAEDDERTAEAGIAALGL